MHALPAPHAGPHLITQQAAHNTTPALLAEVERVTAPLPGVPTATDLAALNPAVAVTLLIVVALAIVAFYVGPAIRTRFSQPKPDSPPAVQPGPQAGQLLEAPGPAPAVERAEQRTDRFVDHLLRQIEHGVAREAELERKLEQANREADQWQQEARRLETMLWQRGRPQ